MVYHCCQGKFIACGQLIYIVKLERHVCPYILAFPSGQEQEESKNATISKNIKYLSIDSHVSALHKLDKLTLAL